VQHKAIPRGFIDVGHRMEHCGHLQITGGRHITGNRAVLWWFIPLC